MYGNSHLMGVSNECRKLLSNLVLELMKCFQLAGKCFYCQSDDKTRLSP